MTWLYNNEEFKGSLEHEGFVYLITNLETNRKYVGKKTLLSRHRIEKTITLKSGVKKRKRVRLTKESDWRDYWSSCRELQDDVEILGKDKFRREILMLCRTRAEMSYYEIKIQLEHDVLLKPTEWYNGFVGCRINRTHLHVMKQ
jgi:hypothetical protein